MARRLRWERLGSMELPAMNGETYVDLPTRVLSLCAGGGGLDLGVGLAVPDARTVCYVENEVTACGVLAKNMEDGGLDVAPIWTDLRTFDGAAWRGVVDLVIGGYPCQPFSNAGRRLGVEDPRHLWPHVADIVRSVEPRWCFFENVGAHLRLGFREVARDLQAMGYRVAGVLLTAEEVGAPHGRERLFIMAHREGDGRDEGRTASGEDVWRPGSSGGDVAHRDFLDDDGGGDERQGRRAEGAGGGGIVADTGRSRRAESPGRGSEGSGEEGPGRPRQRSEAVGDADLSRLEGRFQPFFRSADIEFAWPPGPEDADAWRLILAERPDLAPAVEPTLRGVADGVAGGLARSDQLHILGNGVVPQQAARAWGLLIDALFGGG